MTTYSELVTQIRDYTETDDSVLSDTRVNDMIEHTEERIFRDVDLDVFRQTKYATLTSGDPFVALPGTTLADFSLIRYFMVYPGSGTATRTLLQKKDVSFMNEFFPVRETTGTPKFYATWDHDTVYLAPTPDAAYKIELSFNTQPTGLSSSTTTTWISNNAPRTLLYGCLVEAFKFLKHPDMVQMYEQSYNQSMQTLVAEEMGRGRRDEYMDGVPRMPIPSQQP